MLHGPQRGQWLGRTMKGNPSPWYGLGRPAVARKLHRKLCRKLPSMGTSKKPQTGQVTAPA